MTNCPIIEISVFVQWLRNPLLEPCPENSTVVSCFALQSPLTWSLGSDDGDVMTRARTFVVEHSLVDGYWTVASHIHTYWHKNTSFIGCKRVAFKNFFSSKLWVSNRAPVTAVPTRNSGGK